MLTKALYNVEQFSKNEIWRIESDMEKKIKKLYMKQKQFLYSRIQEWGKTGWNKKVKRATTE